MFTLFCVKLNTENQWLKILPIFDNENEARLSLPQCMLFMLCGTSCYTQYFLVVHSHVYVFSQLLSMDGRGVQSDVWGCFQWYLYPPLYPYPFNLSSHLFVGAILGTVSALVVIVFYIIYPKLRTHTNRILFWRTCCDFGLGALILYYSIESMTQSPTSSSNPSEYWVDMVEHWKKISRCRGLAMAFQFFTFSSEMWFFCNSWDLKRTLDDPFTSDTNNMRSYHLLSWTVAIIMSLFISVNYFGFKKVRRKSIFDFLLKNI